MTVQIKSINNNCQHGRENEKIFILLTNCLCCGKITIIVLNAAKGNKTAAHLFRELLAVLQPVFLPFVFNGGKIVIHVFMILSDFNLKFFGIALPRERLLHI